MAVTRVRRMADSPTGGLGWKGTDFEVTFAVWVDDYDDGPIVACTAVDPVTAEAIPERGDTYETGSEDNQTGEEHLFAIVKKVSAKRAGPRHLTWIVTVRYETLEASHPAMDVDQTVAAWEDPLAEIADVKLKNEIFQSPVDGTIDPDTNLVDANAIRNSAGDIYSPPFMKDETRMVITIARNEVGTAEHAEELAQRSYDYGNTINDDEFWGFPAHSCKMHPLDIERVSRTVGESGELVIFLRVTYTIHVMSPDWDVRPLDQGPRWLSDTFESLPFVDNKAHPYRGLLDGNGQPLYGINAATNKPNEPDVDATPFYLGPLQIYPDSVFADLDLPINILGDMAPP